MTDSQAWARELAQKAGDVVSTAVDPVKTAEAINSGSSLVNGISNADYVASRGGINNQGYYNDVAAHKQLTANERKAVTLENGHIDTMAMLAKLNEKEAAYNASLGIIPRNNGVLSGGPLPSVSITATPPAPEPEMFSARMFAAPPPVKTATLDIILFDEENIPTDGMFDQIFENIGGQELISITRSASLMDKKYHISQLKTFQPFNRGITQITFLVYNKPQISFLLDSQLN